MSWHSVAVVAVVMSMHVLPAAAADVEQAKKKNHRKHHHKHHATAFGAVAGKADARIGDKAAVALSRTTAAKKPNDKEKEAKPKKVSKDELDEKDITKKMKKLEQELDKKQKHAGVTKGTIEVNGPLPADFAERFAQSVAQATGCDPTEVKVVDTKPVALLQAASAPVVEVVFEAPADVVDAVGNQASDPDSKLANGPLRSFLVAQDGGPKETPVQEKGIDVDTEMPYGELEPFGREDTAQELTEQSVRESDEMVDQLERAEVAEEKRSVFRALTRLRGAAITSYDGIARAQTGNIDEYNKTHKWRKTHPLHHLADEESDISRWAFPDNADFL